MFKFVQVKVVQNKSTMANNNKIQLTTYHKNNISKLTFDCYRTGIKQIVIE